MVVVVIIGQLGWREINASFTYLRRPIRKRLGTRGNFDKASNSVSALVGR